MLVQGLRIRVAAPLNELQLLRQELEHGAHVAMLCIERRQHGLFTVSVGNSFPGFTTVGVGLYGCYGELQTNY